MNHIILLVLFLPWKILNYDDFKGKPSRDLSLAAVSSVYLSWTADVNDTIIYNVKCSVEFNEKKSFIREKNPWVLNHEQGHLDLGLAFAREANSISKFRMLFSQEDYDALRIRINYEWGAMNDLYDKETDGSRDHKMQAIWDQKIKIMLSK